MVGKTARWGMGITLLVAATLSPKVSLPTTSNNVQPQASPYEIIDGIYDTKPHSMSAREYVAEIDAQKFLIDLVNRERHFQELSLALAQHELISPLIAEAHGYIQNAQVIASPFITDNGLYSIRLLQKNITSANAFSAREEFSRGREMLEKADYTMHLLETRLIKRLETSASKREKVRART